MVVSVKPKPEDLIPYYWDLGVHHGIPLTDHLTEIAMSDMEEISRSFVGNNRETLESILDKNQCLHGPAWLEVTVKETEEDFLAYAEKRRVLTHPQGHSERSFP